MQRHMVSPCASTTNALIECFTASPSCDMLPSAPCNTSPLVWLPACFRLRFRCPRWSHVFPIIPPRSTYTLAHPPLYPLRAVDTQTCMCTFVKHFRTCSLPLFFGDFCLCRFSCARRRCAIRISPMVSRLVTRAHTYTHIYYMYVYVCV
ncbi:40S ribosomal protein S3, putative [Leishmania donovani]|uniref:40S ribosomal protein S3, putative n=1 Tax=Leishmania donovani TaxID=5661 RepID=E9BQ49_LEIDO|nr:40S ribosomal protein S3, putative [Leishmania donovani]CBZ37261.1 40S ribosomal protein S3, putative [Leishmania donovani]